MQSRLGLFLTALLSSPVFAEDDDVITPASPAIQSPSRAPLHGEAVAEPDKSPKDDNHRIENHTQVPRAQQRPPTNRRASSPRLPTLSGEPFTDPASGPSEAALNEEVAPDEELGGFLGNAGVSPAASPGSGPDGSPPPRSVDRTGANTATGRVDSVNSAVKTKAGAAGKSSLDKAAGKAADFMRTMRRDEDPGPEGERTPRPQSGATGAGDPSRPMTPADLSLSYDAGFKGPFERTGLRVVKDAEGAASVVRRDGSAATPGEVARLVHEVNSEPRALMKRPDFFNVIPRQTYHDILERIREDPSRPEFEHVSLSPDERDLTWDESCSRVSGKCNEHAEEPAYKRGEQVSPESLLAMWEGILTPPGGADIAHHKLGRRFDSRSAWDRIAGGLGKFGAALRWEGGGPAREARSGEEPDPSIGTGSTEDVVDAGGPTASSARRTRQKSPAAPRFSDDASWNWWWILAFPGAALSLYAVWINKREV